MRKAEECLRQEEDRVEAFLHIDSKPKLLKEVENEILANYEQQLLEKETSGCAVLLRDDQVLQIYPPCFLLACAVRLLCDWLPWTMILRSTVQRPQPFGWQ